MQGKSTMALSTVGVPVPTASTEVLESKIVVQDVRKAFGTGDRALEVVAGISFAVPEGKTVAIVGPSGCGKSTLMRMLVGFDRPDSGVVLVDGEQVDGPDSNGIVISQQG
jgi:ABC-type nitrate/sulfonate/bicarbonate transport system ATPase subunit